MKNVINEDVLIKLIELYYKYYDLFKSRCMCVDDVIVQYKRLYEDYIKTTEEIIND